MWRVTRSRVMPCDLFSEDPIITGPLVCHLCDDVSLLYDADFGAHKDKVHSGENEYRKRVFSDGASWKSSHYWPGKRIIVQFLLTFSNFLGLAPRATLSRAFRKSLGAKLHVCCANGRTSLSIGAS